MVVNDQIVPTRLEFSEITKIDLGKGKVDLFYPYSSKQVHLRQREGDINIDRDVHFPYEVMAVHVDSGQIFFGIPKVEHFIINLFGGWFGSKGQIHLQRHITEHVHVAGQNLFFGAAGDIEVHGSIQASGELGMKSGGDIKLLADKHIVNQTQKIKSIWSGQDKVFTTKVPIIKQSILRAENAYMIANNIEVVGSLMVVKDHFQIVSHNNIKVLPIALMTSYSYYGEKMTSREYAIKQVVSEINAGILNIDAGRVVEFISTLIAVEELNLHAKDLQIKHAKDIFDKQMEFKGKEKWYGGRNSWSSHDHTETVVPTVIYADKMKILIDQDATIEAAQIFAEQDILMQVDGNLTVKDGYNLHIHNYQEKSYSLLSFHQGSVKVHTNKNIKDFREGYSSVPTIICAGGTFYGIVGGTMHILGSKIIGHDIHLAVPNGLKLEASKYTDKSLTFVSESGIKLGYYLKGKQEVGVRAGASFDAEHQKVWQRHIESSELTAANSITIMVKDGTFEQISSHIAAKIITVEARNWIAKTYDEQIISDHIKQHVEGGVKIAIKQTVTNSLDKIKMLVNKKGTHSIDQLDRLFKAYDIYKSLAALPTNAVTGGLYAYLEASQLEQTSTISMAIDNTISGEVIIARTTNDIRFQGVQMTAKDVDFTAANFTFETSRDQCDYQYDFSSVNIEIDLDTGVGSNLAASTRSVESSSTIHHANYIKASGNLKITLSGDGKFKGVSLEGTNVDIQANNLILKSVQDIISQKLSGANLHVGFDQKYGITGFGGGVEDGFKDKAWTNQVARIIGSQLVNIIVKETLEIAGGLIANAEEDKNGKLTDKGNLSVNCGRLLVKTIHDYDEGVTLGIGASFQVNQTDQGKKDVSFSHAPVKVEFKDHRREVAGTIGQGKITSGEIKGDQLNRYISQQAQVTKEQQASFDSVVHAYMLKTLLGSKEESKRPPNIKTLTRTICGQTLPEMIRDYFFDIADTAKQAAKDVITSGAKVANIFGAKVNPDQLADNLDKGFDWHLGLKLSSEEVRKFNEKYAKTKKKLEEKSADGDEEEKHQLIFQQNLQQQVAQADSDGSSNKAALQVLLHIYQVLYHKEQSTAEKEGRPVKSFEEFAAYVNKNYIYKDPTFAAKVHTTLVSALLETQLILDARLQSSVEKVNCRSHADQHSSYPEDKTTHHPEFISGGVDVKPFLGAGQKQEDEPKATTTVDDKPFDYSMLFLAKPESKELKLSPDTAALLKAILPFQQVPSSSTTTGGSDWATKEITRKLEGSNFSIPTTSTLLPSEVEHKAISGASQTNDEHRIQEDKLDTKLKECIRDNQEIATKVEEIGYEKFKQQLIEKAKVVNKKQNETKADSLKDKVSFGIKELFGIQEAEAAAVPAIREVLKYLGPLLFAYTATKVANDNIEQQEDEGNTSYYKTHTQKPPPTSQQQKAATSSTFMPMPDPDDLDASKPTILTTPIPSEKPITILSTPDHRDILQKLSTLPGFSPALPEFAGGLVESFPDHSDLANSMNILYKKIDVDYGKLSGKHFDNDLRYLHDKKYAGAKIGDIDPAIRDRMTDLIIFDASGIIKGIHNTQDHHIIPQSILGAKELFEDLGLDIHGQENRQTLPADEKLPTKMTQHIGRHDDTATEDIKTEVQNITRALKHKAITKEQAKQDLLKFIEKEKQSLISGEKSLNSIGRK